MTIDETKRLTITQSQIAREALKEKIAKIGEKSEAEAEVVIAEG